MTDLVAGAIRKEYVGDNDIGREAIEGWINSRPVGYLFDIEAFSSKDASTDTLGVRAIVGQKNAGDQFFFFFGSLTFFCFLTGTMVPFEIIGAF